MICLHLRLKLYLVQIVNLESVILIWLNGIAFTFLLMRDCHYLEIGRLFTNKFHDLNTMCVVKFENY